MTDIKDLPQAELEAMEIVWEKKEVSVRGVFEELNKKRKLAYKTVGTLLTRLKDKGYVEAEERNFAYVFRPLVQKNEVIKRKVDDLVNKVLGGDFTALTLYMADNKKKLSSDQIEILEKIVKDAKKRENH